MTTFTKYRYYIEDAVGNVQTCVAEGHELDHGVLLLVDYGLYPLSEENYTKFVKAYAGWSTFYRTVLD